MLIDLVDSCSLVEVLVFVIIKLNINSKQLTRFCAPLSPQDPSAMPRPTSQDLAGFWDLLQLSIDDVTAKFDELQQIKSNQWQLVESPEKKVKPLACRGKLRQQHLPFYFRLVTSRRLIVLIITLRERYSDICTAFFFQGLLSFLKNSE